MQVTDQKLEIAIGRMFQTGVLIAATVVLVGGILYLHQATGPRPELQPLHRSRRSMAVARGDRKPRHAR